MDKGANYNGVKIGRLKLSIARYINVRCADIYISENYMKHIKLAHGVELEKFGMPAIEYVKWIIGNYNQIRKGTGDSILLVIFTSTNIHHTAAISLNYCTKKGVWEVKTAQPRRTKDIIKKKILWQGGNA